MADGSPAELRLLKQQLEKTGDLKPLNPSTFPGCHIAYSHPSDVARVEHLTYICTKNREDAGPNNNWMDPTEARARMRELFKGCMKGRTLYVVPYCMGPIDSPYSRCGVEITDSAYVVVNMALMTRMGRPALERIARDGAVRHGASGRVWRLLRLCRSRTHPADIGPSWRCIRSGISWPLRKH